jgi:hypothetical protein
MKKRALHKIPDKAKAAVRRGQKATGLREIAWLPGGEKAGFCFGEVGPPREGWMDAGRHRPQERTSNATLTESKMVVMGDRA